MAETKNTRAYLARIKGAMRFHLLKAEETSARYLAREDRHKVTPGSEDPMILRAAKNDDFLLDDMMGAWRFHQDAARLYAAVIQAEHAAIQMTLWISAVEREEARRETAR